MGGFSKLVGDLPGEFNHQQRLFRVFALRHLSLISARLRSNGLEELSNQYSCFPWYTYSNY